MGFWKCTSDPTAKFGSNVTSFTQISIFLNNSIFCDNAASGTPKGPSRLIRYRNTSERIAFTEKRAISPVWGGCLNPNNSKRTAVWMVDYVEGNHGSFALPRNQRLGNVAFLDGHLECWTVGQIIDPAVKYIAGSTNPDPYSRWGTNALK